MTTRKKYQKEVNDGEIHDILESAGIPTPPPLNEKRNIHAIYFRKRHFSKEDVHEWCEKYGFPHNNLQTFEEAYYVITDIEWDGQLPEGRGIFYIT